MGSVEMAEQALDVLIALEFPDAASSLRRLQPYLASVVDSLRIEGELNRASDYLAWGNGEAQALLKAAEWLDEATIDSDKELVHNGLEDLDADLQALVEATDSMLTTSTVLLYRKGL